MASFTRGRGIVTASIIALAAGCGSDEATKKEGGPAPEPEGTLETAANPVLSLRLSSLVYADGDELDVTLDLGDREPAAAPTVILVGDASKDAEPLDLERAPDGRWVAKTTLPIASGAPVANDGRLSLAPGELFTAVYYVDHSDPALEEVGEDLVADFALMEDGEAPAAELEPAIALSDDEEHEEKQSGTLLQEGGLPVQVATEELILYARSEEELERFLELTAGSVTDELVVERGEEELTAYLVALDPSQADPRHLGLLRALFGESEVLYASREEAAQIATLAFQYQLEGFVVSVNPRLQYQAAPAQAPDEAANVTHTMKLVPARSLGGDPCVPGDADRPCVENVPAVWAFNELWDTTDRRVNVAVLDMGFAPNDDFREPAGGELHQCDMTVSPARCARGAAEGAPTVGNSLFGDRSWHGTGVVQTAGGVLNNGFGAAGVAGQVAVPMLYKYDFRSYAFEMGSGIRRAVDDGASVINISAGYPCNYVTNIGADFNICSIEGRLGICTIVTAAVHAAAATTCATLGWVPIAGPIACGAATTAAVLATEACLATLAFGDLRGPMQSAVSYAAARGVPVVTSAGNRLPPEAYPEGIRDLIATGEARTERWQIIPAMIPECVVVGAVDEELNNAHFYGERVDVWAPIRSAYAAPENTSDPDSAIIIDEIGGTSASAPFITGLIATMQAANPELDPTNEALSSSERAAIVGAIKDLLTSDANTFSNAELVDLGFDDDAEERPRLVDPVKVLRAAASNLPLGGYDTTQGFSELLGSDDDEASARSLDFDDAATGTIVTLPVDGASVPADVDWYAFSLPDTGSRPLQTTVTLEYPGEYGSLFLQSSDGRIASRGGGATAEDQYVFLGEPGQAMSFSVQAAEGDDNVYRVTASTPEPAVPDVSITSLRDGDVVCADFTVPLRARASFPLFSGVSVASSAYAWSEDGSSLGSGSPLNTSFDPGEHTVTVSVFGDADASDTVTFTAQTCASEPPVATISTPSSDRTGDNALVWDGFDDEAGYWYKDVTLGGSASDAEDGTLTGAALVWETDQTSFQDAELGTGTSLTVRLYGECFGTTHTIRLQATDSSDTPSVPVTRIIHLYTLC